LSGLKPDVDIKITYTGLRPGEKLYEEKLMDEEGMRKTPNELIHIGKPIPFDADRFLVQFKDLLNASYYNREEEIRSMVMDIVETYHPAGRHGSEIQGAVYKKLIRGLE
jgi:FlaA1/EpsC-like NDP-sugar epimerase